MRVAVDVAGGEADLLEDDADPVEATVVPPVVHPERVGEVTEAFAEPLQPGDRFLLDGRCLELKHAEGAALLV